MKNKLIAAFIFIGLISVTEPVHAGFFDSVGNTIRYSALAVKNTGMALGSGSKTICWDIPSGFVSTTSELVKTAWNHKKITAATSSAIILTLIAIWYTSPDGFMTHPWVTTVATKATGLSREALKIVVETMVGILEQGPAYAQWIREMSCHYANQSCPVQSAAEATQETCAEALTMCSAFLPKCSLINLW